MSNAATSPKAASPASPTSPRRSDLLGRLGAEFLGTFWLTFAGCGAAIFSALSTTRDGVQLGIGFLGVALAFGLTVMTMAIAVGRVSGGHFNPAVTIGLAFANRIEWRLVPAYVVTQFVAGTVAGAALLAIAAGKAGFDPVATGFASNGYGDRSPGGFSLGAAFFAEALLTALFLAIIIGATSDKAPKHLAPFAIGLGLTLVLLVLIPITNAAVNPARALGVAWFAGPAALGQVWLFLLAPTLGAIVAGLAFRFLGGVNYGLGGEGAPDQE